MASDTFRTRLYAAAVKKQVTEKTKKKEKTQEEKIKEQQRAKQEMEQLIASRRAQAESGALIPDSARQKKAIGIALDRLKNDIAQNPSAERNVAPSFYTSQMDNLLKTKGAVGAADFASRMYAGERDGRNLDSIRSWMEDHDDDLEISSALQSMRQYDDLYRTKDEASRYSSAYDYNDKARVLRENDYNGDAILDYVTRREKGEEVGELPVFDLLGMHKAFRRGELPELHGGTFGTDDPYSFIFGKETYANLDYVLPDEQKDYYYILNTEGPAAARDYLNGIASLTNMRAEQDQQHKIDEMNGWEAALYSAASVPGKMLGGAFGILDSVEQLGQGKRGYTKGGALSDMVGAIRGETASRLDDLTGNANVLGFGLGDVYQGVMSGADSMMGAGVFGSAYTALMGVSAAAQESQKLTRQGAAERKIIAGALTSGAAESFFEHFSIEHLINMRDPSTLRQAIKNALIQGGIEAYEEVATGVSNAITNGFIMGNQSDREREIREMMKKEGISRNRAEFKWAVETAFGDAAGGFISTVGSSGGSVAGAAIDSMRDTRAQGKAINGTEGAYDALRQLANDVAGNKTRQERATQKQARKADKLIRKESSRADRAVGKLSNRVDELRTSANRADIENKLVEAGLNRLYAREAAHTIHDVMDGTADELTTKRAEKLMKNEKVEKAVYELMEMDSSISERNRLHDLGRRGVKAEEVGKLNESLRSLKQEQGDNEGSRMIDEASESFEVNEEGGNFLRSTGESVENVRAAGRENGELMVEVTTAEGTKTVPANDISYESEESRALWYAADRMGLQENAAQALVDGFDAQRGSMEEYLSAASELYHMGRYNLDPAQSVLAQAMPEEARTEIYNRGRIDAQMQAAQRQNAVDSLPKAAQARSGGVVYEGSMEQYAALNDHQRVQIRVLDEMGKVLGTKFHIFRSYAKDGKRVAEIGGKLRNADNGFIRLATGEMWIDAYAGDFGRGLILSTASHELTHFAKQYAPAKFQKLADFLVETYGKKGYSVDALVQAQIERAAEASGMSVQDYLKKQEEAGKDAYADAMEEVVADAMSRMLTDTNAAKKIAELKTKDHGLWATIKDLWKSFVRKIRDIYRNLPPESAEAQIMQKFEKTLQDKFSEMFSEAVVDASNAYENLSDESLAQLLHTQGEITDSDGRGIATEDGNGHAMFSLRTYSESGRGILQQWLKDNTGKDGLTKEDADKLLEEIDSIAEICKAYKNQFALFGAWSDAEIVERDGKPVFSVVKQNGDYALNLDFSLVCKKRRTLDAVFNEMIRTGLMDEITGGIADGKLSEGEISNINKIIREHGFEVACTLCFVDAKRYRQGNVADTFASLYNQLVRSMAKDGAKLDFFNYGGNEHISNSGKGIDTLSDSELDFSELDRTMRVYGKKTVNYKVAKFLKDNPSQRKLILRGDFMSTSGFDNVKANNPELLKLYNAKKGSGGPKAAESDVQYLSDILTSNKFNRDAAYAVGGVRIQSFSDYVPRLVFDYVQMVADLAAKKLPAHAYTKELLFAQQFGQTGIKINLSLVPDVAADGVAPGLDKDGNYLWRDGQSFGSDVNVKGSGQTGYEMAIKLQNAEGYSANCGTIAVGISHEHILKLLRDPNIRMVIPYHKSGINHLVAQMNNIDAYTNYTNVQNTRGKNGKKLGKKAKDFNFNEALQRTGDAKAAADEYLAWCDKRGYTPKFDEFREEPGYYKLLEDFNCYDSDGSAALQGAVEMRFPKAGDAFGSLSDLIKTGLEEDTALEERRASAVPAVVAEIREQMDQAGLTKNTTDEGGVKYSIRRTMKLSVAQQIDEYKSGHFKRSDSFYFGETPSSLNRINLRKYPLVMTQDTYRKCTKDKHKIPKRILLDVNEKLRNPIFSFSAGEQTVTMIKEIDKSGYPIVVAITGNGHMDRRSVNQIVSIYGVGETKTLSEWLEDQISAGKKFHVYDIKKANTILQTEGYLAEVGEQDADFGDIIKRIDSKSQDLFEKKSARNTAERDAGYMAAVKAGNVDSNGRQLTEEQQKFFEGSKVRDSKGRLLTVYHGTTEDFHQFDISKAGKNGRKEGYGFYFTDNREITGMYGGRQIEAYLDIKKPLYNDRVTLTKGEVKKFAIAITDAVAEEYGESWKDGFLSNYVDTYSGISKSAAALEFVNMIWDSSESDQDLIYEIANGSGMNYGTDTIEKFYSVLKSSIGVDGNISKWENNGQSSMIYVAFSPEQIKYVDNKTPTSNPDMRLSKRGGAMTTRNLLDGMDAESIKNASERKRLAEYQEKSRLYNEQQELIGTLTEDLKELRSGEGKRSMSAIRTMQDEIRMAENRANIYAGQMQRLENGAMIQRILNRDLRAKAKVEEKAEAQQARTLEQLRNENRKLMDQLQATRERRDERMKERTEEFNERLRRVREGYQESRKRDVEKRGNTVIRTKIKKLAAELDHRLTSPTGTRYVPKELIKATAELLGAIDLDTGKSTKMSEKIAALKAKYDSMANNPEYAVSYDKTISDILQGLHDKVGDVPVAKMNRQQLEDTYNAMRAMLETIRDAVKVTIGGEERNAYEVASEMVDETMSVSKKDGAIAHWVGKSLRAETAFERFGGFRKDSAWSKMGKLLNDGQLKATRITMEASQIFAELVRDKQAKTLLKHGDKHLVDVGLKDEDGKAVRITRGMMLAIYMHLQNEQNARHLAMGGMTVPEFKAYYGGKMRDAYGSSHGVIPGVSMELNKLMQKLDSTDGEQRASLEARIAELTEDLLPAADKYVNDLRSKIYEQMTEYERKWIYAAQQFFDVYSKNVLNEATEEMYHFKKANVEHYFPIHTDPNYRQANFESISRDISLENSGFMKERVLNASNPILLEDITDVINSQIKKVSAFAGLAPAIRTFTKVYGKSQKGYTNSVQNALSLRFGAEGRQYIENLLADLTGSRRSEGTIFDALRGNMAGATLTLNLRVAMGQTASYPTAAAEIGWKPLLKALAVGGKHSHPLSRADQELIAKYSPLLWYRMQGYRDTEVGDVKQSQAFLAQASKKLRWAMGWIQAMDGATVGRLWYAAQYYVSDNYPGLQKGSDDYYKKVAEIYNRIIERTQPNYTVMQRPDILRNPNAMVKQLTMFMTQRLQNYNIVYEAAGRWRRYSADYKAGANAVTHDDLKEARRDFRRAVISQAAAAGTIVAFKMIADIITHSMNGYRDEDDELNFDGIKAAILSAFSDSLISSVLWGSEAEGIFKALWKSIDEGKVSFDGLTIAGIDNFNDALQTVLDAVAGTSKLIKGESDAASLLKAYEKLVFGASQFFGLPTKNAKKLATGVRYHIEDFVNGDPFSFEAGVNRSAKQHKSLLWKAITDQDAERVERWRSTFDSDQDADSAIVSLLRANEPRIKEAARLRNDGDTEGYLRIVKELKKNPYLSQDNIVRAINGEISQLKDKPESTDSKPVAGATEIDYLNAIDHGSSDAAAEAKEAYIEYKIRLGKTREEAERLFGSAVSSEIKDRYLNGEYSDERTLTMLKGYSGLDDDTAQRKFWGWQLDKLHPEYGWSDGVTYKYHKYVEPTGITMDTYDGYVRYYNSISGDGKKDKIVAYISNLSLTEDQKDELYLCYYAESGLKKTPWH